jgi:hypothetical protein
MRDLNQPEHIGRLTQPITWVGDASTGIFPTADNKLEFRTDNVIRLELDAEGNVDLPTNSRVQGVETTFRDLVSGGQDTLEFTDVDTFDIGDWHDHTANPADEAFTVPAGCDGTYHLLFEFEWEAATEAADAALYIMLGGNTIGTHDIARWRRTLVAADECTGAISTYAVLAAADVINVDALVTTGGATPNMGLDQYQLSIIKVA